MTNHLSLVERAARIATEAHKDQVRKSDGSPYIVHPFMCALLLREHGASDTVLAAALTHDVLEDTDVTEAALRAALGDAVVDIVCAVSEDKVLGWEERKQAYAAHVRTSGEEVKLVSIADKIHNLESMLVGWSEKGDALWEHFTRGKDRQVWLVQTLLAAYEDGWDHPLVERYRLLVDEFIARSA